MAKENVPGKAASQAQPTPEVNKPTPTITVSEGRTAPKRKNILTKPKKVSKDVHGNSIEER